MAVGQQATNITIDNLLTSFAVQMRELMHAIHNLNIQVNGQNAGLAFMVAAGYGNAANSNNPGGVSDAQYALNILSYLNTQAGVYYGSATQATTFNFENATAPVWGGK
jgi:hypothetical protein